MERGTGEVSSLQPSLHLLVPLTLSHSNSPSDVLIFGERCENQDQKCNVNNYELVLFGINNFKMVDDVATRFRNFFSVHLNFLPWKSYDISTHKLPHCYFT